MTGRATVEHRPEAHEGNADRQARGHTRSVMDVPAPLTTASREESGPANNLA